MLFLTHAKVDSPVFFNSLLIRCARLLSERHYEDFHVLVHCVPDLVVHPESVYGPQSSKATFSSVDRESSSYTVPANQFTGSISCDPTDSGWNLDLDLHDSNSA